MSSMQGLPIIIPMQPDLFVENAVKDTWGPYTEQGLLWSARDSWADLGHMSVFLHLYLFSLCLADMGRPVIALWAAKHKETPASIYIRLLPIRHILDLEKPKRMQSISSSFFTWVDKSFFTRLSIKLHWLSY